ncbi:hypothetical protein FSP39_016599 [Pinctada imbricata]|uniref:NADP-dependent oxidoreductase domain-containing protein n=1 Tax=Pinctada imbricata TaxID=66713 RepID=A0AA88YX67_PINIB|nr:hypothetical protein FSP39_016599 [Pinctada imbricata]
MGVRPGAQEELASPACMQHPSLQFGRTVTSGYFHFGKHRVQSLIKDEDVLKAVTTALDVGYRHIDTAYAYLNEEAVGEALDGYLRTGKVSREDLFIVTKLAGIHMEASRVRRSIEISLRRLKLQYVDLFLIHMPVGFKYISDDIPVPLEDDNQCVILDYSTKLLDIWKEMENLVDAGLARSIGVSNFNSDQVERICNIARIKPVTNQIECHLHFPNAKLAEFCKQRDITISAYSPLSAPGLPREM